MKKNIILLIFGLLLFTSKIFAQAKYTVSGYIKEAESSELLPGVTVYIPNLKIGTTTNSYGFYSLTLPEGNYELRYSFVGYNKHQEQINLTKNISLNIDIETSTTALEEIEIVAEKIEKESEKTQMSLVKVPVKNIEDIPAFMGEKDVLKALQLMPGVQSGSEGSTGLYVRGGGPDQNLIILDDATVYNANHLFGFFSVFNGDALKSVELYKGGFPARFGGRLSSVIKLDMKEGNKKELKGKFGIGLLTSNILLEGPVGKSGKTSFLVSGRRSYVDVIMAPLVNTEDKVIAHFYDLNMKINHEFNDKNKLYLSGYFGEDKFGSKFDDGDKSTLGWGNATATARWNHQFNSKLFSNTSLIFSRYLLHIKSEEDDFNLSYKSSVRDFTLKYDVDYFPRPEHNIKFGMLSTLHNFIPSALVVKNEGITDTSRGTSAVRTVESAVFVEDDIKLFNKLNINAGLRLSFFSHESKSYFKPEPRISLAYMVKPDLSVKASYATMNQYIHLLSNSGIGLPTDLWVSSTENVKPQSSQQVAFGIAKDLTDKNLTVTIEGYYKKSDNVIAYKEGASFLLIDDLETAEEVSWEENITTGEAWSYGLELLIQRKFGKFTGWLGYTLSKTDQQFDELNFGNKFPAKYDRRHDVSLVGIYKPSERITISGTWVFGTGNTFTIPKGEQRVIVNPLKDYVSGNGYRNIYDGRNNFRAAPYHRLDFGIQFHKQKTKGVRTWEISLYNVYSRQNPFYYGTDTKYENGQETTVLKQYSLFPLLPAFRYKFEF